MTHYAVRKHVLQPKLVSSGETYLNEWLDVEYYIQSEDSEAIVFYRNRAVTMWWCPYTKAIFSATKRG